LNPPATGETYRYIAYGQYTTDAMQQLTHVKHRIQAPLEGLITLIQGPSVIKRISIHTQGHMIQSNSSIREENLLQMVLWKNGAFCTVFSENFHKF
jgi:hypothetical protein